MRISIKEIYCVIITFWIVQFIKFLVGVVPAQSYVINYLNTTIDTISLLWFYISIYGRYFGDWYQHLVESRVNY